MRDIDAAVALRADVDPMFVVSAIARSQFDVVIVTDENFDVVYISDANIEVFGRTAESAIGTNTLEFIHPEDLQMLAAIIEAVEQGYQPRGPNYYRVRHDDGSWVQVEATGLRLTRAGETCGWVMVVRRPLRADIYANVVQRLYEDLPLSVVVSDVPTMLMPTNAGATTLSLWPSSEPPFTVGDRVPPALTGMSPPEGSPFAIAAAGATVVVDDLSELDPDIRLLAERERFGSMCAVPVREPNERVAGVVVAWALDGMPTAAGRLAAINRTVGLLEVALAARWHHTDLKRSASSDELTGLTNRRAFEEALRTATDDGPRVLLAIDLDGFKAVNDRLGHLAGDELLRVVAGRLTHAVGDHAIVARIGGDEFSVLASCSLDDAEALGQRIVDDVSEPIDLDGVQVRVGASVGITTLEHGSDDGEHAHDGERIDRWIIDAQRRADAALYEAKRSGRGRFVVMHEHADR